MSVDTSFDDRSSISTDLRASFESIDKIDKRAFKNSQSLPQTRNQSETPRKEEK
jgi:hypothetical protein